MFVEYLSNIYEVIDKRDGYVLLQNNMDLTDHPKVSVKVFEKYYTPIEEKDISH